MERILVVEDDPAVQRALNRLFTAEGFGVDVRFNGAEVVDTFRNTPPAAVILDLRLPGMSGRDICRELKRLAPNLPVIVLSAKTEVADKVLLLELGADDYVTKPFSPRELLARVRAAMRRSQRVITPDVYSFADVVINFTKMEVRRAGRPILFTAQEFKILKFFVQNAERVITREELLNQVWGYTHYPTTRTVDNHILKLRQKLEEDPAVPVRFCTVHGVGYKFIPDSAPSVADTQRNN